VCLACLFLRTLIVTTNIFCSSATVRSLRSFPTRRSSDLLCRGSREPAQGPVDPGPIKADDDLAVDLHHGHPRLARLVDHPLRLPAVSGDVHIPEGDAPLPEVPLHRVTPGTRRGGVDRHTSHRCPLLLYLYPVWYMREIMIGKGPVLVKSPAPEAGQLARKTGREPEAHAL